MMRLLPLFILMLIADSVLAWRIQDIGTLRLMASMNSLIGVGGLMGFWFAARLHSRVETNLRETDVLLAQAAYKVEQIKNQGGEKQ